jgi:hypothetical protein
MYKALSVWLVEQWLAQHPKVRGKCRRRLRIYARNLVIKVVAVIPDPGPDGHIAGITDVRSRVPEMELSRRHLELGWDTLDEVFVHELAHIICETVRRNTNHGPWHRQVSRELFDLLPQPTASVPAASPPCVSVPAAVG